MSEENVEIVRRCNELMSKREFSAIPQVAHPDLVFDAFWPPPPTPRVDKGHA